MNMTPRFQGNAIEFEPGKWGWECQVLIIGGGEPMAVIDSEKKDFPSKSWALKDLNTRIQELCSDIGKNMGGTGKMINMKTNEIIGEA